MALEARAEFEELSTKLLSSVRERFSSESEQDVECAYAILLQLWIKWEMLPGKVLELADEFGASADETSGASGSGVHGVDLSPDQTLLASADEFGLINLFRYPCVKPEARGGKPPNRVSFPGHASAALGCQWTTVEPSGGNKRRGKRGGDEWLISIGGLDLTVFQWRRV